MPATTAETLSIVTRNVSVAPLVLLSAVDHYNRVIQKASKKRVVGVLLGQNDGKNVRVSNSFAGKFFLSFFWRSPVLPGVRGSFVCADCWETVPFEEDDKDPSVWFLDHNYVEGMNDMFKKVNAREKLIGWYHSGPKLRASDLEINELFKRYTPNPLLVIIDVHPKEAGVPTDAYFAVEEIKDVGEALLAIRDSRLGVELTADTGWNKHFENICPHSLHHRSRRSRRNRRRASSSGYPRRGGWDPLDAHNEPAPVATGVASSPC